MISLLFHLVPSVPTRCSTLAIRAQMIRVRTVGYLKAKLSQDHADTTCSILSRLFWARSEHFMGASFVHQQGLLW